MPMAIATCWLSATARMAMPIRLFRKNQVKAARNTRPSAIKPYIRPISSPSDSNSSVNCQSMYSDMHQFPGRRRLAFDVVDLHGRADHLLAAVLVGDLGGELDLRPAAVERFDHR